MNEKQILIKDKHHGLALLGHGYNKGSNGNEFNPRWPPLRFYTPTFGELSRESSRGTYKLTSPRHLRISKEKEIIKDERKPNKRSQLKKEWKKMIGNNMPIVCFSYALSGVSYPNEIRKECGSESWDERHGVCVCLCGVLIIIIIIL